MSNKEELTLDVRPLLARGEEPFGTIMALLDKRLPGQSLRILAPFEPLPLYPVLAARGLQAQVRQNPESLFEITFQETAADVPGKILDLRSFEPPEPMQRTLEALSGLGRHEELTIWTRFRPVHLLDMLPERGFDSDSEELATYHWETRIWRDHLRMENHAR